MARDLVSMMQQLGFERFSVAGHDRGGRVAYRMAPDHPDRVDRLAVLDILPTETVWEHAEEGGPIALWRAWCDEVQGLALDAGHFFPEEAPEQTADALNLKNHQTFALFTTLL
jgi:pimeloyl-ACP methyl ester carboxylesterase